MNLFRQIEVTTDSIMKIKHTQITLNTAEKNNTKQKKERDAHGNATILTLYTTQVCALTMHIYYELIILHTYVHTVTDDTHVRITLHTASIQVHHTYV